jgi:uncharacterized protein YciI
MLFMVRFTDHPDRLAVRQAHMEAHMAWVAAHAGAIRIGGPLRQDPDGPALGAMWLVEAGSAAEIERMLATDPFWVNGLRAGVEILHWKNAVPAGPTTI